MRLVDADKLNRKDVNCANTPMNFIDTAPTVEAIPKADYENRLKADMVAMLDKIKEEVQKEENIWYHDCEADFSKKFDVIRVDTVLSIIDKYRGSEEA